MAIVFTDKKETEVEAPGYYRYHLYYRYVMCGALTGKATGSGLNPEKSKCSGG